MSSAIPQQQYDFTPPRPYAWKTDEFQTQNEPRKTSAITNPPAQFAANPYQQPQHPAPIGYNNVNGLQQSYLCPHCMNRFPPHYERRISTTGWIVFAVLLVAFFPLFWIGLLIKEDVWVCQACNARIA
jgi:hypothetical protein